MTPIALLTGLFAFENPIEFKVDKLILSEENCQVIGITSSRPESITLHEQTNCADKYQIGKVHRVIWADAKLPLNCESQNIACEKTLGKIALSIEIQKTPTCLERATNQKGRNKCLLAEVKQAEKELNDQVLNSLKNMKGSLKKSLQASQSLFFKSLEADLIVAFPESQNTSDSEKWVEEVAKEKMKRIHFRRKQLNQWLLHTAPKPLESQ